MSLRRAGRADRQPRRVYVERFSARIAIRGDCTGPGYFQTDVAFYKNVQVTDSVRLQFRWDIFNFFNDTNFSCVNAVMQPSSAVFDKPAPNATVIESAAIPSSFGQAGSARDPREMQFGLKILW